MPIAAIVSALAGVATGAWLFSNLAG